MPSDDAGPSTPGTWRLGPFDDPGVPDHWPADEPPPEAKTDAKKLVPLIDELPTLRLKLDQLPAAAAAAPLRVLLASRKSLSRQVAQLPPQQQRALRGVRRDATSELAAAAMDAHEHAWDAYMRGCLLAAVAHWAREQFERARHFRIGPELRDAELERARNSKNEWGLLLYEAAHELRHVQATMRLRMPDGLDGHPTHVRRSLMALTWACAATPDATPPIVLRMLRAIHRRMLAAVGAAWRDLEDARLVGIDPYSPERERLMGRQRRSHASPSRWRRPPSSTLQRLGADADVDIADVRSLAQTEWRRRRSSSLIWLLSDVGGSNHSVLGVLPRRLRAALDAPEGSASEADERLLDLLWCWYCDHVADGYLAPGASVRAATTMTRPETRWVGVVSTLSALDRGLQHVGIGQRRGVVALTYSGHKAMSYDFGTAERAPLYYTRPARLTLGPGVLGDRDRGALGTYLATASVFTRYDRIGRAEELYTKMHEGYFGRGNEYGNRLDDAISRVPDLTLRQALQRPRTMLGRFLLIARTPPPGLDESTRERLLAGAGRGGLRRVQASEVLAALFFLASVVSTGQARDRRSAGWRDRLRAALREEVRPYWNAHRAAGWSVAGWSTLLVAVFGSAGAATRGSRLSWQAAVARDPTFAVSLMSLLAETPADGSASLGPGDVPADLWEYLSLSSTPRELPSAVRALVASIATILEAATTEVLEAPPPRAAPSRASSSTPDRFPVVLVDYFATATASSASVAGSAPDPRDVDENDLIDERPLGLNRRPHTEGNMMTVVYKFVHGERALWIEVKYMHLMTGAELESGDAVPDSATWSPDHPTGPLLGTVGASGNAVTQHPHVEITVWEQRPPSTQSPGASQARPIALLSPWDFWGPVPWEGEELTGSWPQPAWLSIDAEPEPDDVKRTAEALDAVGL